uniref:Endonuclease/exonuclease/phosphatase domain-containing protein n=1 Tax=Latimeria chalumnae TaxID=7897 RepID=H2ZXN8_LATCH
GGFNCVLDAVMDKSSSVTDSHARSTKAVLNGIREYSLVDIWKHSHATSREYSFHSQVHDTYSRIDLMLISSSLLHRVEVCSFLSRSILDHSPLTLSLRFPEISPTAFRWWFNPRLLILEEPRAKIQHHIEEYSDFNSSSPDFIWEALKAVLRGHIISFSTAKKKKFQSQVTKLEMELRQAETEDCKHQTAESREKVVKLWRELNVISTSRAEHVILCTKSKYYARGDKAGRLLAWQLRRQGAERCIVALEDISEEFVSYYSSLYTSELRLQGSDAGMSKFLNALDILRLEEEDQTLIN